MNAVPHNRWIHRCAMIATAIAFLTICAGGMVTSTGSGLADPEWPVSLPNLIGGLLYEHGHRLIGAALGILTLLLCLLMIFKEPRPWARRLGIAALALVVCQGLLGRATVLMKISPAMSISHALLAEIFFCVMVVLAMVTSPSWNGGGTDLPARTQRSLSRWAWLTVWIVFLQIALGAFSRHTGSGYALHVVGAVAVTVFVTATTVQVFALGRTARTLMAPAIGMTATLIAQLVLGPLALILTPGKIVSATPLPLSAALPITLHVVAGAMLLVFSFSLALPLSSWLKSMKESNNTPELIAQQI